MTTLNDFKALRASVPAEVQTELSRLVFTDPEVGFSRMVEIAAEAGLSLTLDEVRGFLRQMDDEEEFDDIELDPIALNAIAGGGGRTKGASC